MSHDTHGVQLAFIMHIVHIWQLAAQEDKMDKGVNTDMDVWILLVGVSQFRCNKHALFISSQEKPAQETSTASASADAPQRRLCLSSFLMDYISIGQVWR